MKELLKKFGFGKKSNLNLQSTYLSNVVVGMTK